VALRVVFLAGSADDPPGKEGLTLLTATTMATSGTATLTYPELLARLYPFAASIDVHVDRDETVFSAEVTEPELAAFYPLLEEVILAPRLDAEGFDRVRAQTTSQLTDDLRGGDDEALGKEALQVLLYQGHPYGHPALGTERGLAASTLADVKAQRARVLCRDRVVVGVAGGFPETFAAKLATDLGALPSCPDGSQRTPLPAPRKLTGFHVLVVDKPSADATAISMGYSYDLTRASTDFPAVAFFTDYLGLHRQSSGRLYEELREKRGLNYGDFAYAEHFEQDGGSTFRLPNVARRQELFSMWLRPVKSRDALFALHAALHEYATTLTHHIPQAEVQRYRTFLTRHTTLEELTPSRRIGYAIDDLTYGLSRPYLDTMHDAWQKLDEATLAAAAERHLQTSDMGVAIVAKDGAALAAALVAGTPPQPPRYDSPRPPEVTAADRDIVRFSVPVSVDNVRVVAASDLFRE
jgi:zinc protease